MITPGGNPHCKYCGELMLPGKNICWSGVCMCGEEEKRHWVIEDHGYVDASQYNGVTCEAQKDA